MKLRPNESDLIGQWRFEGDKIIVDATCKRIEHLITEELQEIARDPSGWDVLYIDPNDSRFWELTYPQSEMHGGGPPRLRYLPPDEAKKNTREANRITDQGVSVVAPKR